MTWCLRGICQAINESIENLLNFGFTSTRVGEGREQLGECIVSGGDGEEVADEDNPKDSESLPNLCMLREKVGGWAAVWNIWGN